MKLKITVLPGDGIGVEVTREAVACLETIAKKFGHEFEFSEHLIGGAALDKTGAPLPDATLEPAWRATPCCSARWARLNTTTTRRSSSPKPACSASARDLESSPIFARRSCTGR